MEKLEKWRTTHISALTDPRGKRPWVFIQSTTPALQPLIKDYFLGLLPMKALCHFVSSGENKNKNKSKSG